MKKKLPIGINGFEKLRTNDFYYADKTLFIKELLQNWGEANLFISPRRFGKTPNMSMLKGFFKIGSNPALKTIIGDEAMRFRFLKESEKLSAEEKEAYARLIKIGSDESGIYAMTAVWQQ